MAPGVLVVAVDLGRVAIAAGVIAVAVAVGEALVDLEVAVLVGPVAELGGARVGQGIASRVD